MSGKLQVDVIWDEDDFKPFEKGKTFPDDGVTLTIDEEKEKIILSIPEGTGLVKRRTIQRRVQSIARSGLLVSGGLRIGAGFPIEEKISEEKLSETLLQAGHGYVPDAQIAAQRAGKITSKPQEAEISPPITPTPSKPTLTPKEPTSVSTTTNQDLVVVGIFAAALLESLSELFVSKDAENQYSLDFGSGNVIRFQVQDGTISDLSTLGVSEEDTMIQKALNTIKTYLK